MSDKCNSCDGAGAAQAKTGDNRKALSRAAGMAATGAAIGSKTKSRHSASGTANHWVAAPTGYGDNENIKGYGS